MPFYVGAPPLVRTDQANTWSTGAQDMSAATSKIVPVSGGYAPTADGSVGFDSTQKRYVFGGNALTGYPPRVLSAQWSSTDTMDAGTVGVTETAFATTYQIPANYLINHKIIRVLAVLEQTTPGTAVSTVIKLRVQKTGPTNVNLYVTSANTQGTNITRGTGYVWLIQGTGAASTTANVEAGPAMAGNSSSDKNTLAQPAVVDTTVAQTIQITNTFGGSTAGNVVRLRQLVVEELN